MRWYCLPSFVCPFGKPSEDCRRPVQLCWRFRWRRLCDGKPLEKLGFTKNSRLGSACLDIVEQKSIKNNQILQKILHFWIWGGEAFYHSIKQWYFKSRKNLRQLQPLKSTLEIIKIFYFGRPNRSLRKRVNSGFRLLKGKLHQRQSISSRYRLRRLPNLKDRDPGYGSKSQILNVSLNRKRGIAAIFNYSLIAEPFLKARC